MHKYPTLTMPSFTHQAFIAFTMVCMMAATSAWAAVSNPSEPVQELVPDAQLVGETRFTKLIWDVYDIGLFASHGTWNSDEPYALSLYYLRDLEGNDIAKRSIKEIRGLGFTDEVKLAAWHEQMRAIFPDVTNGSELTGIYIPGEETRFYQGRALLGTVGDPEFGKQFFGIWLHEKTSQPELRRHLLGKT